MNKIIASAAGATLITGIAVGPALADYPPQTGGNTAPDTTQTTTGGNAAPASSGSLANTGSDATTLGLLAGLAALGAGTGILVAARRRTN